MATLRLFAITLGAAMLAGCPATPDIPDPEPTDTTYGDTGANTGGFDESDMGGGEFFGEDFDEGPTTLFYFDFDSSEVRGEYSSDISRHALQLAENPAMRIRLEGHADERGSREYNIGLGERRSQAVRRMLLIQGASASQIATVSFGEERPAALGADESAYAQNRRVEIKFIN